MFLFSKRIYDIFSFFLIVFSTNLNAQTYELVDQNKEWDSDDKKTHLYFKDISPGAELTITVSLDKLKIKDDSGKEYGWDTSNSIPSGWEAKILDNNDGNPLNQQGCSDCKWTEFSSSTEKNKIIYVGQVGNPHFWIMVLDENGATVTGLERIKAEYRITENFTVKNNSFNSCLSAQVFTVNEAFIGNEIVCNEYNLKVYEGTNSSNNSS